MNVTVYDFTGIYENEGFDFFDSEGSRSLLMSESRNDLLISLKDISGTNCICDDYACDAIKKRCLEKQSANAINISFFDNGNYHYMSKILMDLMCESYSDKDRYSFDLVVFDHHTDMKWTSYGDILSCGSWILNALKDRPELNRVFIIGADSGLIEETKTEFPEFDGRVFFLSDISDLKNFELGNVYISVDKDVLSEDELKTNWDQGEMGISELKEALIYLNHRFGSDILAIDVCGESLPDSAEAFGETGIVASNLVNRMIIDIFQGDAGRREYGKKNS